MGTPRITQQDIITEVGSICAGNSTRAFSQMVDYPVLLEAPELRRFSVGADMESLLGLQGKAVVGVYCRILTGMTGCISLIFEEKSAYECAKLLSASVRQGYGFMTEIGISSLKEIGNVVVSAYTNAMSLLLGQAIIPSVPVFVSGSVTDVVTMVAEPLSSEAQFYVHTMRFCDARKQRCGTFYIGLSLPAGQKIGRTMRGVLRRVTDSAQTARRRAHA